MSGDVVEVGLFSYGHGDGCAEELELYGYDSVGRHVFGNGVIVVEAVELQWVLDDCFECFSVDGPFADAEVVLELADAGKEPEGGGVCVFPAVFEWVEQGEGVLYFAGLCGGGFVEIDAEVFVMFVEAKDDEHFFVVGRFCFG